MSPVAAVASGERKLSLSFGIPDTLELALLLRRRHYLCKLHLQTILKAVPPFPVEECGTRVCATRNPLAQGRPTAEKRAPRVLFLDFPLVFECLECDGFLSVRARIGRGLSAKQMPLSDPRQVEEMYPAMSSASPIGFQGKSDAAATLSLLPLIAVN